MSSPAPALPSPPPSVRRRTLDRGLKLALILSGAAFVLHLPPLLLPRDTPDAELDIARALPDARSRVPTLERLLRAPERASGAQLREGAELLLPEAADVAHALLEAAELREPGALENHLLRARVCRLERSARCVATSLEKARTLAPADPRADLLAADFAREEGDTATVLQALKAAWAKAPQDGALGLRVVEVMRGVGALEDAERMLGELAHGGVPQARLFAELGRLRAAQGLKAEALEGYRRAAALEPTFVAAHYLLGEALYEAGDLRGGEEALRHADRLDLNDGRALARLCALQLVSGQANEARITRMDLERRFGVLDARVRGCPQQP